MTESSNNNDINNVSGDKLLHVIYDYVGKESDELTLRRGSMVEVLSKDKNISGSEGWWTGRLMDSEMVGIFPANFVDTSGPQLRMIAGKDLQIGQIIGFGGFGLVHQGKFGDIDVAIKTAKSLTSYDSFGSNRCNRANDNDRSNDTQKKLIDALLREANLFANLNHRNIIKLFGVTFSGAERNLCLVMEYAHGGALSRLLDKRKAGLYPTVFLLYAQQIADGMKYLHSEVSESIIHRDLKCSNILILESITDAYDCDELSRKTLKITDFGLAKKQVHSSNNSTAGTYAWMSPESIQHNLFSTKSDVWSFGVLLWECLTGEIPYKGFDQMQVAFGIARHTYSLHIPATCPKEFSQLIKDCWHIDCGQRPTFDQLCTKINEIIDDYKSSAEQNNAEQYEGDYQSLQNDWKKEIEDIFDELRTKEREIRSREHAVHQITVEQNNQRLELEKWEKDLHQREMNIIEQELKLVLASANQERNSQTPKIQKRSGHFVRALLFGSINGIGSLSSATANELISNPTNFRHLISISRDNNRLHPHPADDSKSIQHLSTVNLLPGTNAPNTTVSNGAHASSSIPTTPNFDRLRTYTPSGELIINKTDDEECLINNIVHCPSTSDDSQPASPVPSGRPFGCWPHSQQKISSTMPNLSSHKDRKFSATVPIKRKLRKSNGPHRESIWYLNEQTFSNKNKNPNNANDDNNSTTSTQSTSTMDQSNQALGSSSSVCLASNDRSLHRGIFDIGHMLTAVGLSRRIPNEVDSSPNISKEHRLIRSTSAMPIQPLSTPPSSSTTTPSPLTKKQHKRTSSSPIKNNIITSDDSLQCSYRARPSYSPVRPNSLLFSSIPPPPATTGSSSAVLRALPMSRSDSELDDTNFYRRNESIILTNTPEEDEFLISNDNNQYDAAQSSKISAPTIQNASNQSNPSFLLDIDSDEQVRHKTKVLPPASDTKSIHVPNKILEQDFLR